MRNAMMKLFFKILFISFCFCGFAQNDSVTNKWSVGVNYTNIFPIFNTPDYGIAHQINLLIRYKRLYILPGLDVQGFGILGKKIEICYEVFRQKKEKFSIQTYHGFRGFNYKIGAGPPLGVLPTRRDNFGPYYYFNKIRILELGGVFQLRVSDLLYFNSSFALARIHQLSDPFDKEYKFWSFYTKAGFSFIILK